MRLAWFAPHPDPVIPELSRSHHIDRFDARTAHDFVWRHFRSPYDLTVVELADAPSHTYAWPYLFHDPGILILRATSLQHSRTATLSLQHRRHDLRAERTFGGPDLLRAPLSAARLVVVHDEAIASVMRTDYPGIEIRVLPMGATPAPLSPGTGDRRFRYTSAQPAIVERAARRAQAAGSAVEVASGLEALTSDDVAVILEWPPTGAPPLAALSAMAAGLPTIVFETEAVALWPALDPQTWQPRGYRSHEAPVTISIDPRDEEHSLMLAMKRLAADADLRRQLGATAARWAAVHAGVTRAAGAWDTVLQDAAAHHPAAGRDVLPAHLTADGSARARAVLAEFGVSVDFLET